MAIVKKRGKTRQLVKKRKEQGFHAFVICYFP